MSAIHCSDSILIESHLNACKRQICVNMARHSHSHSTMQWKINFEWTEQQSFCLRVFAQNNERVRKYRQQ